MFIQIGYDIVFEVPQRLPMLLMLSVHPQHDRHMRRPDRIRFEPDVPFSEYIDMFGNRVGRIVAPPGQLRIWNDALVEVPDGPDLLPGDARQLAVEELPSDVLQFLLGSRYVEMERLSELAWSICRDLPLGYPRVQAICNFAHNHVRFDYNSARPTKTAFDVYTEQTGVCRDFMHLAIALCRCVNIPARYATGYLGDIGVPVSPAPMDFSAWFEVYLGGQWWTFDARHNRPRIGRVLMARGRDAVDVALTTSFGTAILKKFEVTTREAQSYSM
jgi:transglutaminase-like putative cysteine protease